MQSLDYSKLVKKLYKTSANKTIESVLWTSRGFEKANLTFVDPGFWDFNNVKVTWGPIKNGEDFNNSFPLAILKVVKQI